MRVEKIALNGFRNYEWETVEFDPGTNVISGQNAQGKTNLLEAVYMLSCGRSFRTRFDKELVGFGYSEAEILADVYSHEREQTVSIRLRPGQTKRILVNGVKKTGTELAETVNVVLFCPDDLNLIKEGAAVRRRLLDNAISQIRPRYGEILSEFNKLYEHKTRILKDWREKPSLLDTLDEFSDGMCRASAQLIRYRAAFTARLNEAAPPIHREFSGDGEELEIRYQTVSTVRDPFAAAREIYYDICEHQEKHRQAELESGPVSHRRPQGRSGDRHQRPACPKLCLPGADADRGAVPEAGRAGDLSGGDRGISDAAAGRRALRAGQPPTGVCAQPHRRGPDPDHLLRGRRDFQPDRREDSAWNRGGSS